MTDPHVERPSAGRGGGADPPARLPLRVLIVDDERLAREDLRRLVAAVPELELVGDADDIDTAERAVRRCRPDVLFLDIEMPGGSGFELLRRLEHPPRVVFVTAYHQHIARATALDALDYLLKPVHPDRFALTVRRLLEVTGRSPGREAR